VKIEIECELLAVKGPFADIGEIVGTRYCRAILDNKEGETVFAINHVGNARDDLAKVGRFITEEEFAAMSDVLDFY